MGQRKRLALQLSLTEIFGYEGMHSADLVGGLFLLQPDRNLIEAVVLVG